MSTPLVLTACALAVLLSLWALWFVIRDRPVILRQLFGAAVVEAALLVQVVVAAFLFSGAGHDVDPLTFWGYLVVILLVLPVAAFWAFAERTRWSSVVLFLACWVVVFLEYRLMTIWGS